VPAGYPRPEAVIEGNGINLGGYFGIVTIDGVEIRLGDMERIELA
jgi:hypothetical protein